MGTGVRLESGAMTLPRERVLRVVPRGAPSCVAGLWLGKEAEGRSEPRTGLCTRHTSHGWPRAELGSARPWEGEGGGAGPCNEERQAPKGLFGSLKLHFPVARYDAQNGPAG